MASGAAMNKPKPCPLCARTDIGVSATRFDSSYRRVVEVTVWCPCGLTLTVAGGKAKALKKWNTRS